jgi:hypothetical protein
MPYPAKSDPAYDYEDFQASQPTAPPPGNQLVNDFANLKRASDATIDFLKVGLRSDNTGMADPSSTPARP